MRRAACSAMVSRWTVAVAVVAATGLAGSVGAGQAALEPSPPGLGHETPPELLALAKEFRSWRRGDASVPDYAARYRDRQKRLPEFQQRLAAIDTSTWSVGARVDYLVLLVELNDLAFDLAVLRPEHRNPDFYVMEAVNRVKRRIGSRYQLGPVEAVPYGTKQAEEIIAALEAVGPILSQAPALLKDAVPELAAAAIERTTDVGAVCERLGRVVGEHVPPTHRDRLRNAAVSAGRAMEDYRSWLVQAQASMTAPYAIGTAAFEWHARNVLVLPYNSQELLMQAEMERSRNWAFLQFERQKNRHLPGYEGPAYGAKPLPLPVAPVRTFEEYAQLKDATDVLSRVWASENDLFTHPEGLGPMRVRSGGVHVGTDRGLFGLLGFPQEPIPAGEKVEFMVGPDHFFSNEYQEFAKWMDPGVNHPHSDYPGHTFETWVSRRTTNELRRRHNTRGDAWTFYVEELQMQLDYPFVRGPRVREWIYAIALWRVERIAVAVKMADGSMTPQQAEEYLNANVPYMTSFKSKRMEVWGLLARPTLMLKYQPTKFQLLKVLAARVQQLGLDFDLRSFHDQLLATGQVPLAMTLWEMAGDDTDVAHLWEREPIPSPASQQE